MPTSAPGTCSATEPRALRAFRSARLRAAFAAPARGFTLVEILVTIAILAIGATVAVVAFGTDERATARREARRFAGAIEHAAALAQWRNEVLGVSAEPGGWRFWRRSPDAGWTPLADDDVLSARALPAPLGASAVAYGGRAVAPDAILPLRPSGRNEPFAFALGTPQHALLLSADPLNRVTVSEPDDAGSGR